MKLIEFAETKILKGNNLLPPGKIIALRQGRPVWIGNIDDPIEDIDADKLILSPFDYEEFHRKKFLDEEI